MKNLLCKVLCAAMMAAMAVTALPLNETAAAEQKSASVQNVQGFGKQQSNELKKIFLIKSDKYNTEELREETKEKVVAIIDSSVDYNHPKLSSYICIFANVLLY